MLRSTSGRASPRDMQKNKSEGASDVVDYYDILHIASPSNAVETTAPRRLLLPFQIDSAHMTSPFQGCQTQTSALLELIIKRIDERAGGCV